MYADISYTMDMIWTDKTDRQETRVKVVRPKTFQFTLSHFDGGLFNSNKKCALCLPSQHIIIIIKWSGISPSFARLWLADTAFTRVYLRVNWPQMLNDGLFGVSVMSQRKRRFSCQIFAWTGEFGVHFLMTSQYRHLISRRFWLRLTTPWTFLCD